VLVVLLAVALLFHIAVSLSNYERSKLLSFVNEQSTALELEAPVVIDESCSIGVKSLRIHPSKQSTGLEKSIVGYYPQKSV
jgi:hypothetical protein